MKAELLIELESQPGKEEELQEFVRQIQQLNHEMTNEFDVEFGSCFLNQDDGKFTKRLASLIAAIGLSSGLVGITTLNVHAGGEQSTLKYTSIPQEEKQLIGKKTLSDQELSRKLFNAVNQNRSDEIEGLIMSGANVNYAASDNRVTPLILASQNGNTDIVRILLNHNANVNATKKTGTTALMWAAINNHGEVLDLLLDYGAKVDQADIDGNTALIFAAHKGHTEIVKNLLFRGSNPDHKGFKGKTAVQVASDANHIETIEAISTFLQR